MQVCVTRLDVEALLSVKQLLLLCAVESIVCSASFPQLAFGLLYPV
jgi:hypothetical protein